MRFGIIDHHQSGAIVEKDLLAYFDLKSIKFTFSPTFLHDDLNPSLSALGT